jgi:hypothetical protein
MPTLSASDYTQFLKYKAAATAYQNGQAPRRIQTTDQVVPTPSMLNTIIRTSQASLVVTPTESRLVGNARVQAVQPERTNNPNALSTISYGGVGPTSSKIQQIGGLPTGFKSGMNTYTRPAQHAGWGSGANKS